jgi:predicted ABC-type ATPase
VLPEILGCKEFVNADNIAAGLSPFNPESVALEAGRIMLKRIYELLDERFDFAFETTLATRSYVSFIRKAQQAGYEVTLLYFWLDAPETAYNRVAIRVSEGGHDIPIDVIKRRYYRGLKNLIDLYIPICNKWLIMNNVGVVSEMVAHRSPELGEVIINSDIWKVILTQSNDSSN